MLGKERTEKFDMQTNKTIKIRRVNYNVHMELL